MKSLFSHSYSVYSNYPTDQYVEMTAIANYFAKKQGFETIFYGDETSIKDFKKINFDHIELLPSFYSKNLPKCFWSSSKLFSLLTMNEPCIHIDNDFFLVKPIPENFLKNDIFCFHDESFVERWITRVQKLYQIRPSQTLNFPIISYNCGIMGGQDIKTIKYGIQILIDYIVNNASIIDDVYFKYKSNPNFFPAVLMEQVWLFQIFKFLGKDIKTLINPENWEQSFEEALFESGYIHLMKNKHVETVKTSIKEMLLIKKIKY